MSSRIDPVTSIGSALDAQTRLSMQELLLEIWAKVRTTLVFFVTHEIDEANFLADRTVLMTNRVGKVKAQFALPFPRPRGAEIVTAPAFMADRIVLMTSRPGKLKAQFAVPFTRPCAAPRS